MTTFKEFLAESGRLIKGFYQMPYSYPTRADRAFERIYNQAIPDIAKQLGIAKVRVKLTNAYAPESGAFHITLTGKDQDRELLETVVPAAVKRALSASFPEVTITEVRWNERTLGGKTVPYIMVRYKLRYPEQWLEWDRQRYGHKI